jgi:hypothetical protein
LLMMLSLTTLHISACSMLAAKGFNRRLLFKGSLLNLL